MTQIQALGLDPIRDAVGRRGDSKVPLTDRHHQSVAPPFSVDPWQDGEAGPFYRSGRGTCWLWPEGLFLRTE